MVSKELHAIILALALSACASGPESVTRSATNLEATETAASAPVKSADGREFVKQGAGDVRSPFTRETVIRLNAIVARSLAAIDEYDANIKSIRASIDASVGASATVEDRSAAEAGVKKVAALYDQAKLAYDDMRGAENDLKSSGEEYNAAILAGMVGFVVDVENELGRAKNDLSRRSNDADQELNEPLAR